MSVNNKNFVVSVDVKNKDSAENDKALSSVARYLFDGHGDSRAFVVADNKSVFSFSTRKVFNVFGDNENCEVDKITLTSSLLSTHKERGVKIDNNLSHTYVSASTTLTVSDFASFNDVVVAQLKRFIWQ